MASRFYFKNGAVFLLFGNYVLAICHYFFNY
ncbi:hypothetical protein YPC_3747 [Yersinia pestis biovar Medievalis str. Harbin 35]|nr:hypothetical protein YPC_3747 [Yersinia pestis biovar Medievalis str. Harbin 35]EEO77863.1 hypothetical protein YP516_0715 [Yersinia pestis Nepal516]EEO79186.1 hypothetical protein YPF_4109 [Yersinia pestis biovar Orientalis str. India 195]EEO85468.1 hypothetical protein YPH_1329 [Yersinia pestis biovar Orientalis str. PEXU2]EEO88639.1 hypothetical protein YPS_4365 [Yersinia pestis Pestoides A]